MKPGSKTVRIFLFLTVFWTLLIVLLTWFNYRQIRDTAWGIAVNNAHDTYNRDLVYRRWATQHGGVYVPVSDFTPSNPHLSHVEDRDVITTGGKKLTLVNPAYMTRQVHELGALQYGLKGHITSLNPIRPANTPDGWEWTALQSFDDSKVKEVVSLETIDGVKFLRMMRPMITETGCLKCHEVQGYKAGDIRGGISVSVPWEPLEQGIAAQRSVLIYTYGLIWLFGLAGIGFGGYSIRSLIRKKEDAEEDLVRRNEELQDINREKDTLLSVISHDLRSPFNAILGISGILAKEALNLKPVDVQKMSDALQRSIAAVYRLLQNLLEWAQIQRGLMVFKPDYFLVRPVIDDCLEMLREMAENKKIHLTQDIPHELELYADQQMVASIIRNLVVNAIKFTGTGGEVTISSFTSKNGQTVLIVRDNGIGMTPEIKDKLFQFKEKTNRKGTQGETSSGLGLVIASEFIARHSGTIRVDSEEGKGTCFEVIFPPKE